MSERTEFHRRAIRDAADMLAGQIAKTGGTPRRDVYNELVEFAGAILDAARAEREDDARKRYLRTLVDDA